MVPQRGAPEVLGSLAIGNAQHHHAEREHGHSPSEPSRLVREPEVSAGRPSLGLLDPGPDLDWLIDTTTILAAAETYLLVTRLTSWDLDTYQGWLATSFTR